MNCVPHFIREKAKNFLIDIVRQKQQYQMGGERTINIDPSLFTGGKSRSAGSGAGQGSRSGGHNRTIRRERKSRPKPKGPSATSLRKNLLAKIKEHQQKENSDAKHKESKETAPPHSGNTSYGGLDGNAFEDEFTRSLAYLSALAKTRETTRADKKKQKARLKFRNPNNQSTTNQTPVVNTYTAQSTISRPQVQSQPTPSHNSSRISYNTSTQSTPAFQTSSIIRPATGHNKTMRQLPERPTGLSSVSSKNVPDISLEMPPELDNTPKVEVQVLPTPGPAVPIKNDPPYGVLKGGTKPTYRSYTKTQRNPSSVTTSQTPQKSTSILSNPNHTSKPVVSATEHIRNETTARLKKPREKKLVIPSNSVKPPTGSSSGSSLASTKPKRRSKTVKRTTSTRHFKLGKDAKRRVISVFIKNNKTRRRVKLEIGQLKRVPIKDVKSYLRKHNLLKVGSSAPNDVLRQLYEQSVLSGDVHNLAKDTLIHNFMNDKE